MYSMYMIENATTKDDQMLDERSFEMMKKSEMIDYLANLGVTPNAYATKVTKREIVRLYRMFRTIPMAISVYPPTFDGAHMDYSYRCELLSRANQDILSWQHLGGNIKYSKILTQYIIDTKRKLDMTIKSEPNEKITEPLVNNGARIDGINSEATSHVLAKTKPVDQLDAVFEYLGNIARNNGADITIVFKSNG